MIVIYVRIIKKDKFVYCLLRKRIHIEKVKLSLGRFHTIHYTRVESLDDQTK